MGVKIVETVLRDAQQSLIATRMTTDEMIPVLEKIDAARFYAMEVWGGATFDAALRYLGEDPWERLREIRKRVKHTKLQMLLRGQNLVGYKHYSDDVVKAFVDKAVQNGIDIVRIFDALNDVSNMELSIRTAKRAGAHVQGAIAYTISPVHTTETYVKMAKELAECGVDSICIKDMAGLLSPFVAETLVREIKKEVRLPVDLHSHYTSGLASMAYIKGIEAGADIVDTAISPFAMGTSQPPTESIVPALSGTKFDTGIDIRTLREIARYFKPLREKYIKNGLLDPMILSAQTDVLTYQIPGGMLSNLISQLKGMGALNRLEEVLEEVPRVRKDLGYPPLVTPASQIVGTQAVLNVLSGERYKVIIDEVKAYVMGAYGKPPAEISDELMKKISEEGLQPAEAEPIRLEQAKDAVREYVEKEEDVLTYALFPDIALDFFKKRQAKHLGIDPSLIIEDRGVVSYPV